MSDNEKRDITLDILEMENVPAERKGQALQTAIYNLRRQNIFIGSTLQCLNIMYTHTIKTAAIGFSNDNKRWDMFINPHFFCNMLTDPEQQSILLHEISHVLHKHPIRVPFIKLAPRKRMLMNIAADMAINQNIPNLPTGCDGCRTAAEGYRCENPLCPGKAIDVKDFFDVDEKGVKTPWKHGQTMEYYYEKLLSRLRDPDKDESGDGDGDGGDGGDGEGQEAADGSGNGSGGKGKGKGKGKGNAGGGAQTDDLPKTIDQHMWDGSVDEKEVLEATEDLVKRAMIKSKLDYDKLPGAIKELLRDIEVRKAELNYKALILSAIKRNASGHNRKNTWTRPSKRYGEKAPGTKIGELPKLTMYLDTSGSISIEELNEFIIIVENFLRVGSRKCNMAFFHTEMYGKKPFKLGERINREDIQSGGTDLAAVLADVRTSKPDLTIIITDGCYGDVDVESWLKPGEIFPQVLWIISKGGTESHPLKRFGDTIKVPNPREQGQRR